MISQDYTEYYRLCAFRMDEPMAVSFLQSRGILPETVKRYQIGFDKNWIDPAIVQQAKESASAFHSCSRRVRSRIKQRNIQTIAIQTLQGCLCKKGMLCKRKEKREFYYVYYSTDA